ARRPSASPDGAVPRGFSGHRVAIGRPGLSKRRPFKADPAPPASAVSQQVGTGRTGSSRNASRRRQADDEAGADDGAAATGIAAVLGADDAAMRLDDLLRDRQAEPGMGAE